MTLPPQKLKNMDKTYVSESLNSIMSLSELSAKGKPKDIEELKQRITDFFTVCSQRGLYCGIESLALSLGVSRVMFWRWCQGDGCSPEWTNVCQMAKQTIATFLEQAGASGALSPVLMIWLQKNWLNYSDVVTIQSQEPITKESLPAAALPNIGATDADSNTTLQIPDTED